MCGICGFTGTGKYGKNILDSMMNRIIHRGPDGGGNYIDEGIAMGFRRLSIIDLDNGAQPMKSEDGKFVISFNGEIYNYKEIRKELIENGYKFSTKSDTEVILNGYAAYGEGILSKLRGMFAFVIWDRSRKRLFAARDMFGIKPFYYVIIGGELIYASEIKSILEYPEYKKEVNLTALSEYLSFQYSVLDETFFKGIYRLRAGHFLIMQDGEIEIKEYFDPIFIPTETGKNGKVADKIDEAVKNSIKYHMVSDVEVAALLSSGVDSSYVASNFSGSKTFTVGFDYEKYNEIPYAKRLSDRLGIKNYSKVITTEEFWKELPKIQYFMDEPLADPAAAALYFVDREAAKEVKVVLSGEGADELFGGYNIYLEPEALRKYQKLPKIMRKVLAFTAKRLPKGIKGRSFLIRGSKSVEERFIGNANIFSVEERNRVLKHKNIEAAPQTLTRFYYDKVKKLDDVSKMQYIDLNFWLVGDILLKADKMSMAHSLESRVPFLDKEVFKVARTLSPEEKTMRGVTKAAFREAAKKSLSSEEAAKKKLGFPVPIRVWLKEDKYYNILKKEFTGKVAGKFFNITELVKLLDTHKRGKYDYSRHIWNVYMFLLWYKEYFSESGPSVSLEDELKLRREKIIA